MEAQLHEVPCVSMRRFGLKSRRLLKSPALSFVRRGGVTVGWVSVDPRRLGGPRGRPRWGARARPALLPLCLARLTRDGYAPCSVVLRFDIERLATSDPVMEFALYVAVIQITAMPQIASGPRSPS